MRITSNMSLQVWDQTSDHFNHTQLASNWDAVDRHDHASNGGAALGANSVGTTQLAANSVTAAKIANGAITDAMLSPSTTLPIGTVIQWWRPTNSYPLPTGYVVCDGSTVLAANHGFGGGNITLPDLRNSFALGADPGQTYGSTGGTGTSPGVNGAGGTHAKDLSHTHHAPWPFGENGGGGNWIGAIRVSDSGVLTTMGYSLRSRATEGHTVGPISKLNGSIGDNTSAMVNSGYDFNGAPYSDTGVYYDVTTDSQGSSTQDFRPKYVGLIYLMKVKAAT